jgi:cytochrome c peroxidase
MRKWFSAIISAHVALLGLNPALAQTSEPIKPIPLEMKLDPRKVELGEKLFFDKRASKDNSIACIECHQYKNGGADRTPVSIGIDGKRGPINAPTIFNMAFNFRLSWDGRDESLESQFRGPLHNAVVMGTNWDEFLDKLKADPAYVKAFNDIYNQSPNAKNVSEVVATFERSLITPNAKFDRYLRGDKLAINADELRGYQLFKNYGCIACHQGVNVGGNMFQVFGVMGDYFKKRGNITPADLGRFNTTKNEADKHVFRVPSLRNVAVTAPYFHDGSAATLEDAVDVMFQYQLGRPAPKGDKELIIKFLRTLTGEFRGKSLQ